nr:uncharacterized protein LOC112025418 [Quercus suber]
MYNEIDGDFDDIAISTFKVGLPTKHGLRKSLTEKPVTSVCQLIDRIDKYKKVEENQQQGKGSANTQAINVVFRELVHQVLEKNKNESFFKWSNKMVGNPMWHNQNLYCQYQQDQRHTTKDYRNLWDHLDQLVREGKLKHLLHHSSGQGNQTGQEPQKDAPLRSPLGTINVIFATPKRTGSCLFRVMFVSRLTAEDSNVESKRVKMST